MKNIEARNDFDPEKEVPSLGGKVLFITGEIHFAVNHLGNSMVIDCLLPTLLRTADLPNSDVRILVTTSMGYGFHPSNGISFAELDNRSPMSRLMLGGWIRYGHSKLANILYPSELARRYPQITSVSVHPGVVATDLMYNQTWQVRWFIHITCWMQGIKYLTPQQGAWNQVWCATVAKKKELVNGGFYYPVGVEKLSKLDKTANDKDLAGRLWNWTQDVLQRF
ncbi:hypothetical protein N0V90_004990 [Kalmusia sp. IMI 367209]|nr:hypothetical protein N0V90_004990 [Kalmusia sp. IMI 367209]